MVKWLSKIEGKKNKSLVPSTIITLFIVGMLILSGPAQAVAVNISGLQPTYTKGSEINFMVNIELNNADQFVSLTNISLNLTGPVNKSIIFALDGTRISTNCNIKIKPVSIPENVFGYGNGYGYDDRSGYGYDFGYGYGYGYGYGGGGGKVNFIYNVTIDTHSRCLPAGNYSVVASLDSGKNVVFQSQVSNFELLKKAPGGTIKAKLEIKPETINLASKGIFTAFINLPEEFDVRDINVSTLDIMGAHAVSSSISNKSNGTLIAKFNRQDLVNVHTGNAVKFNVTGEVDGTMFVGSDTVKVIDNGKNQKEVKDCDCDKNVKDDDHENQSDDQVKEHENDDNKVKDHSHEKNKEDTKKSNNVVTNKEDIKKSNNVVTNKEDTKKSNNGENNKKDTKKSNNVVTNNENTKKSNNVITNNEDTKKSNNVVTNNEDTKKSNNVVTNNEDTKKSNNCVTNNEDTKKSNNVVTNNEDTKKSNNVVTNNEDTKKSNNGENNKKDDKNYNNNGGQGKNVVVNNFNINDNSDFNIYNQGGNSQKEKIEDNGNSKNQGNNGGSKQSNNKGKK